MSTTPGTLGADRRAGRGSAPSSGHPTTSSGEAQSERRLLVLSFHAPPERAVGGLRWAGLSKHLARRGWSVRVITASPGAGAEPVPDGLAFEEVRRRTTLQDRYRAWRRRQRPTRAENETRPKREEPGTRAAVGAGPATEAGSARSDTEPTSKGSEPPRVTARSELAALLDFPDHGRGWVLRAARTTRRLVREWRPDVVVSTGPPHSAHLAAAIGLTGSQALRMVDLRDPWVTPWHGYAQMGWSLSVLRRLERRILENAAAVLVTTPELREALAGHYPAARVHWLPNGVDATTLPPPPAERPASFSLTHLGSVYFNRDPTPVLRAFARFLKADPAAAPVSKIRFVGDVSVDFRAGLERTVRDLELEDRVEITGSIPRERALEVLAGSRMALVLAQGQEMMVPAKLYEAIGLGLPTLVVTETASATGSEARRLGAAVHTADDEAGMAATLARLWSGEWKPDGAGPARVHHAHLAGELEEILAGVMDQPRAD